jgi:hypothetical protein
MGDNSFQVFRDKSPFQRKEVIFFGSLDDSCFKISYKLYNCKILHSFVFYEHEPILDILEVKTIIGHENISEYLDTFAYVLDIY